MTGTEDHVWIVAGTIAASLAALIALFSLIAILRQIHFAKIEVGLVRDDLNNSKEALRYAQEQSELVREQMAEVKRRPSLYICARDGRDVYDVDRPATGLSNIHLRLHLINRGERPSSGANAELYVPLIMLPTVNPDDARFTIDGIDYVRLESFPLPDTPPAEVPTSIMTSALTLNYQPGNHMLHWKIVDEYGRYPRNGGFGDLLVRM